MPPEPATQWRASTLASSGGTGSSLHHEVVSLHLGALACGARVEGAVDAVDELVDPLAVEEAVHADAAVAEHVAAHGLGVELVAPQLGDAGRTLGVEVAHRDGPLGEAHVGRQLGVGLVASHGQPSLERRDRRPRGWPPAAARSPRARDPRPPARRLVAPPRPPGRSVGSPCSRVALLVQAAGEVVELHVEGVVLRDAVLEPGRAPRSARSCWIVPAPPGPGRSAAPSSSQNSSRRDCRPNSSMPASASWAISNRSRVYGTVVSTPSPGPHSSGASDSIRTMWLWIMASKRNGSS